MRILSKWNMCSLIRLFLFEIPLFMTLMTNSDGRANPPVQVQSEISDATQTPIVNDWAPLVALKEGIIGATGVFSLPKNSKFRQDIAFEPHVETIKLVDALGIVVSMLTIKYREPYLLLFHSFLETSLEPEKMGSIIQTHYAKVKQPSEVQNLGLCKSPLLPERLSPCTMVTKSVCGGVDQIVGFEQFEKKSEKLRELGIISKEQGVSVSAYLAEPNKDQNKSILLGDKKEVEKVLEEFAEVTALYHQALNSLRTSDLKEIKSELSLEIFKALGVSAWNRGKVYPFERVVTINDLETGFRGLTTQTEDAVKSLSQPQILLETLVSLKAVFQLCTLMKSTI